MWLSSPRTAVTNLVRALELEADRAGAWPAMNLPGISVTVDEMLAALERVGGAKARSLVDESLDPGIARIVCSWPGDFDVAQALDLGFARDRGIDDLVDQYVADFLPSRGGVAASENES